MSDCSFVHLHVHTHFSLLDGATRIDPLVDRVKQFKQPAVAITDHGNMFGVIELYQAARKAGIKPIVGCETYLASGDRRSKDRDGLKEAYHLLLLAMNLEGYHNLMRLSSIGYTEGFYRKPRIDKEVLRELSAGLLCTSTCLGGEVPQTLLNKDRKAAEELAKTYLDIFGPDRFFIELQDHGLAEQKTLNPELADMAKRLGVAVIATNDVHYLDHDDVEAHDVLCCINTGSRLSDEDRFRFQTDQFYLKSTDEMAALFADYPGAVANTLHVAGLCNLELDLSQRHAPVFRVPDEITDKTGRTFEVAAYLRHLVYEGAAERYGQVTPELRERIDYELDVITSKGFASYFLIVWDCVKYARRHGIPVGARGSGCSSVVAYCLHISKPDPIRYGLYFERFMDPDRDEMPDIDLDICQNGRAELLDYVRERYGHVAQIITFGTLKAKAVIKDVSRVLGLGFEEANNLTKLIPNELKITLDKALDQEPELKKRYNDEAIVKRVVDIGRRLEGVARNAGVHAAGVVVADKPLDRFLPLYRASGQQSAVTQFDGPTVEKVGLLKMDFLGLRTLTTLERARQLAGRRTGRAIDIEHLDLTDEKVYQLFARGDTKGVFQFESGGMRDVIMRMQPNRIEDLIAANALFRPGPMEYIADYIARKHGQKWTTPHPIMTEVLQETYGIMVYQEQVSRLVNRLGGIELKTAFRLAKAISKKKTDMIEAMREPFLAGCGANGVGRHTAEAVFADILKFGGYAFNKAHSTGYALVAYQTAWMKTYFPVEFMAAVMTFEMSSIEKVAEYREACKAMGIEIRPPDINQSEHDFIVETAPDSVEESASTGRRGRAPNAPEEPIAAGSPGDRSAPTVSPAGDAPGAADPTPPCARVIRFGLGAIKGVGAKAVSAIVEQRCEGGSYKNLFDFCERVDLTAVNRAAIEALICAGAFDGTGGKRKALVDALDRAVSVGQTVQGDRRAGQMSLFGGAPPASPVVDGSVASRREEIAGSAPLGLGTDEWSEADMLAREKAVLGFYITKHPLANYARLIEACATAATADLARYDDGTEVIVGGMVSSLRIVPTRNGRNAGKRLGVVTFEDLAGRVEAVVFSEQLTEFRSLLVPDALVFLEGAVDRKREEPSIRVSRVVAAGEALQAFATKLLLDVGSSVPVDTLAKLLRDHGGGSCRVYLNVETGDGLVAQMECSPMLRVTCSAAFLRSVVALLGDDAVQVIGPGRRAIPWVLESRPSPATSPGVVQSSAP